MKSIEEVLGKIIIKRNKRSKSFNMRVKEGVFHLSVPFYASDDVIRQVLQDNIEPLLNLKEKYPYFIIDSKFAIESDEYSFSILCEKSVCTSLKSNGKDFLLLLQSEFDFNDDSSQQWLRKVIENTIVNRAKVVLPRMLKKLAVELQLEYSRISINRAKTKWGSCSNRKSINISCYTLLLPYDLRRYILLHELAHLTHLNHSPDFWTLLNTYTDGQVATLEKQLKNYKRPF